MQRGLADPTQLIYFAQTGEKYGEKRIRTGKQAVAKRFVFYKTQKWKVCPKYYDKDSRFWFAKKYFARILASAKIIHHKGQ